MKNRVPLWSLYTGSPTPPKTETRRLMKPGEDNQSHIPNLSISPDYMLYIRLLITCRSVDA